jgi:glutamate-ammonia-ligase adenylyltransferase
LLVNTLAAYEEYYRKRAQLWEIQALSRARPVAGDLQLGDRFRTLAGVLTDFREENVKQRFTLTATEQQQGAPLTPALSPLKGEGEQRTVPAPRKGRSNKSASNKEPVKIGLAAYTPDWKQQIAHMRQRIEKERTPFGQADLSIKTGAGGLIDAEFIAQALSLENGWLEPNSLRALERARDENRLPERDAAKLIDNFRELRRIESILRRWSFEGEAVLPSDPEPFYRVSIRCGFKTPDAFRQSVAASRRAIRDIYRKIFPGP